MRLFFLELTKIVKSKSCIAVFFAILLCNIGLLFATNANAYYDAKDYQRAYQELQTIPDDEKASFLELHLQRVLYGEADITYSNNRLGDIELFKNLQAQWNHTTSYSDLLTDIKESAESSQLAIYKHQSDFQKRNDAKTIKDYEPMEKIVVSFTNSEAFQSIIDFTPSDIFAIAFIFFMIVSLLVYEKEHKLFYLLKSTKHGRVGFILSKVAVILSMTLFTTIVIWGSNFFVVYAKYGSIPLFESLQSIPSFISSTLSLTTGQYLILFLLSKLFIYALISMIILFITLKSKKTVEIYVTTLLVFAISFALYHFIPVNSTFSILKHSNLIPFLLVNPIYDTYLNINICQYPIHMIVIFWVVVVASLLLCIISITYRFSKDKTPATFTVSHWTRKKSLHIHTNIAYHECYKLLIIQKGAFILLIFMMMSSFYLVNSKQSISSDEAYYRNYMSVLEGPYTQEKQRLIETESQRFEELHQQVSQATSDVQEGIISQREKDAISNYVNTQTLSEQAFHRVLERIQYVEEHPKYPIIYETGYLQLFGMSYLGYQTDFILALFLVLTIILLFVPFITTEYSTGMMQLINVQKNGRDAVFKRKWRISFLLTTLCSIFIYTGQLLLILSHYGLHELFTTNLAIPELASSSLPMPLICQIGLLYLIRLVMAYVTLVLVFYASQILKNTYTTLSLLCATLAIPLGIGMIGILFINNISLNAFFSGNLLLNEGNILHFLIFLGLCLGILYLWKHKKRNLLK